MEQYRPPDFTIGALAGAPCVKTERVTQNGVAPPSFHATTIYPEYFQVAPGNWRLARQSRMDCAAVVRDADIVIIEMRKLKPGDEVVVGRTEDGSEGIYVHTGGFTPPKGEGERFRFRLSRSREKSFTDSYDRLYEILRYERDNKGYVVWVLGPAVVFDADARDSMAALIGAGYAQAVLAGNAVAAHDLEAELFNTALGLDIRTGECMTGGHRNHLEAINEVRKVGSIREFIQGRLGAEERPHGILTACVRSDVPFVLAGSIRDDGPLPGVITDTVEAQDEMRRHAARATTVIALATQLHAIAVGNMTPSYQVAADDTVRPVHMFVVDTDEFVTNKIADRGSLSTTVFLTNAQDFLVNLARNLIPAKSLPSQQL